MLLLLLLLQACTALHCFMYPRCLARSYFMLFFFLSPYRGSRPDDSPSL